MKMGLSINLSRTRIKDLLFLGHDGQISFEARSFGKMAYDAVGSLARSYQKEAYEKVFQAFCSTNLEKKIKLIEEAAETLKYWGQGGINKILLHAFVGGTMAELSGYNFERGAVAAGLNEALQKDLGKWEEKYPVEHQLISLLIGAKADELAGDGSNIGALAALYGTKYNWDHTGHNNIINSLYDPDDFGLLKILQEKYGKASSFADIKKIATIMREEDTRYDTAIKTQIDPISHAMPFRRTVKDYHNGLLLRRRAQLNFETTIISNSESAELLKEAEKQYRADNEEYRCKIVTRCKEHLQTAINNPLNYKALTWALHVLTDDYAHRQNDSGWGKHLSAGVTVSYLPLDDNNIKTAIIVEVDNMNNPQNKERFRKSSLAAKKINDMFLKGTIGNIDQLFPEVHVIE